MIFCLLAGLLAAPLPAALAEPTFRVLPGTIDRGTAARVLAEGLSAGAELSGLFDGQPIFFFPAGGRLIGLLGADVLLSPGRYPLTLSWPGGRREVEVTVRDRSYGVRSINLPENQVKLSKSDQKRAARELKAVQAALAIQSPEKLWQGAWLEPVNALLSNPFGRQTRINGVLNPRPHAGADFDVPEGTEVKAPADGLVLLVDFHFFDGGSIYIDHGQSLISMYFHLSEFKVKVGDQVKQGQTLALSGQSGLADRAHLHYGLQLNQARIDPLAFQRLTSQLPRK